MQLIKHLSPIFMLSLIATVACGADDESMSADTESAAQSGDPSAETAGPDVEASDSDIVASVDVGYGTVQFHESRDENGEAMVMVSQLTPNTYGRTPLHETYEGNPTTLEVFLAVAPDQEPPAALVEAHASQADALERPDHSIVAASFDADGPIAKSVAACEALAYPQGVGCYTYRASKDDVYGENIDLDRTSNGPRVNMGICNQGNATVWGRLGVDPNWNNGASYTYLDWATVPVGYAWLWFDLDPKVNGCTWGLGGCQNNVGYRVRGWSNGGSSNDYDLVGARRKTLCP
jgi:hypothetical protein